MSAEGRRCRSGVRARSVARVVAGDVEAGASVGRMQADAGTFIVQGRLSAAHVTGDVGHAPQGADRNAAIAPLNRSAHRRWADRRIERSRMTPSTGLTP